ncbi:MAG: C39 family peptidase [Lachnospiraceae bacterium]|nr:C39 family peptidase [Lachnospiraceae bacterium]
MGDTDLLKTEQDKESKTPEIEAAEETGESGIPAAVKFRAFILSALLCAAVLLLVPQVLRYAGTRCKASGNSTAGAEAAAAEQSAVTGTSMNGPEPAVMEEAEDADRQEQPNTKEHYQWLLEHEDLFPEGKVAQAKGNEGLTEFLYVYGHEGAEDTVSARHVYAKLSPEDLAGRADLQGIGRSADDDTEMVYLDIPLIMQWDKRWGFYPYGSSVTGLTGCGPTCLSMVVAGLTGNVKAAPDRIAKFAEDEGYYMQGTGTRWSLFTEGAEKFRVSGRELPASAEYIKEELDLGHPVIMSMGPGIFTDTGHFILIAGYCGDRLIIHDPNSRGISSRLWEFDKIRDQIYGVWAFSTLKQ